MKIHQKGENLDIHETQNGRETNLAQLERATWKPYWKAWTSEPGLRPTCSLFELNSDNAICPKDKMYYHTGTSDTPLPVSSARIKEL